MPCLHSAGCSTSQCVCIHSHFCCAPSHLETCTFFQLFLVSFSVLQIILAILRIVNLRIWYMFRDRWYILTYFWKTPLLFKNLKSNSRSFVRTESSCLYTQGCILDVWVSLDLRWVTSWALTVFFSYYFLSDLIHAQMTQCLWRSLWRTLQNSDCRRAIMCAKQTKFYCANHFPL